MFADDFKVGVEADKFIVQEAAAAGDFEGVFGLAILFP